MPPTETPRHTGSPVALPDEAAVRGWLQRHDLIGAAEPLTVTPLPGGVSGVVLDLVAGGRRLVLKQSRRRLDVRDEWYADVRRLVHEGLVGRWLGSITPGRVPEVILLDPRLPALLMERAPLDWREWRGTLLDPHVAPAPLPGLGSLLAAWHCASARRPDDMGLLENPGRGYFAQLRLDPFLRTTAERAPRYADHLARCHALLCAPGRTFVHGDFSPKNVLAGVGGYWLLDFEVAHLGQPAFDVAFLLCHLQLKATARPTQAARLYGIAATFCQEYFAAADRRLQPRLGDLALLLGCLLLARVHGSSPAGYLNADQQADVERRAGRLLTGSLRPGAASVPADPWPEIEEMVR